MKTAATKILKRMTSSSFDELVDETLALYRELYVSPNSFGDARDEKLSAKGYLAEALHNARTTLKKIEQLDKVIDQLDYDASHDDMMRFVGNVYAGAVATRMDKGVALRPITGNLHRMVDGDPVAFVSVIVASNALGSNPFECVALAALRATRDHPEAFGNIDDWDKHHKAIAEKQARLNELYAQIATEWRTADLTFDDNTAIITLKYEEVVVPVAPPNTLGARLCDLMVQLGECT